MSRSKSTVLSLEVCAWSVGLLCLAALLIVHVQSVRAERTAQGISSAQHASGSQAGQALATTASAVAPPATAQTSTPDLATYEGVIGRLEVPALRLQVPILNDYDSASLRRGVGRMKGTAVPGGLGNLVLAGHRDTYFRPLRGVKRGMLMRIVTADGAYDYSVDATSIVAPEDVDVLDIGSRPEMTLITCYPFDFIGAAPKRFIVHTHLVSVAGEVR